MSLSGYAVLQSNHFCTRCGKCCFVGGNMRITASELSSIADYLGVDPHDSAALPVVESRVYPSNYVLTLTHPCFFLDKVTHDCLINDVKPRLCREYPWLGYENYSCTLNDVIACPSAVGQLLTIIDALSD